MDKAPLSHLNIPQISSGSQPVIYFPCAVPCAGHAAFQCEPLKPQAQSTPRSLAKGETLKSRASERGAWGR